MLSSNEPSLQPSLFPSDEPSVIVRDHFGIYDEQVCFHGLTNAVFLPNI
jgi:hypothetical protein